MLCYNLTRIPGIPLFSLFHLKPRNFSLLFTPKTLNPTNPSTHRSASSTSLPWIASSRDRDRDRTRDRVGKRGGEKRAPVRTSTTSWDDSAESYFSRNGRNSVNENDRLSEKREDGGEKTTSLARETETNGRGRGTREVGFRKNSSCVEQKDGGNMALLQRDTERKYDYPNGRSRGGRETRAERYEEVEEEDGESVDDPRWDSLKHRYDRFDNRESAFDKPEVRYWNKEENWGRKTWKEGTESSVPKMVGQGVYGVGPVLAALTVERRELYALYVQQGLDLSRNNRKKKDKKGVERVLKLAEKKGLKVVEASKHDLNMVVDNRPHQGLVLDASPLEMVKIRELEPISVEGTQRAPLWMALDEVTDPQNLGAIVRSAYFFGVDGVVLCAKNSAPLSGVVSKASAGSLELIELRFCKNMMQFLSSSVDNGWRVIGGSVSSNASPLNEVKAGVPTILVLGSEGSGLRPLVERSCTHLVKIPGNDCIDESGEEDEVEIEETDRIRSGQELKSFLAVESLNVSVAAGVLLYHLVGNNSHLGADPSSIAPDLMLKLKNTMPKRNSYA